MKSNKGKATSYIQGNAHETISDFSAKTLHDIREWHNICKVMKGKNLKPRILYLARLSFRFEGEIKSFYRQTKAKRVQHHQSNFTRNVKGTSLSGKQKTTTRNIKIMK